MSEAEIGTAVAELERTEVQHANNDEPRDADSALVRIALEKGVDVDTIERLVALQERNAERQARMAFVRAMAAFQAEVGPVPKTGEIKVDERSGRVRSRWAPLPVIAEHIRGPLAKHGLSYSWDSTVDGEHLTVTCTVRHVDGHEQTGSFTCKVSDAKAPGMSGIQVSGSARTYGERYSLVQALGLTTTDEDDDGRGAGDSGEVVSEEQLADLEALADEVGADRKKFCAWLRVASLADIPASQFEVARNALEAKRA